MPFRDPYASDAVRIQGKPGIKLHVICHGIRVKIPGITVFQVPALESVAGKLRILRPLNLLAKAHVLRFYLKPRDLGIKAHLISSVPRKEKHDGGYAYDEQHYKAVQEPQAYALLVAVDAKAKASLALLYLLVRLWKPDLGLLLYILVVFCIQISSLIKRWEAVTLPIVSRSYGSLKCLLTNQILTHIYGACYKDDASLNDILHVLVDSQELKCNEYDPQQEYSEHYT